MRTLIAFLLLCCTASAADRDPVPQVIRTEQAAPAVSQGPLFSIWCIDGHGYQWQQDQIDAGLPLEPSIRFPQYITTSGATRLAQLEANAPILATFDNRSIVLRMNNITVELDQTLQPRLVLTEENWSESYLCVRLDANGELDDLPTPSVFAGGVGLAAWAEAGRLWAVSPWMTRLQEIITNPTGIILRENNEGPRMSFASLYQDTRLRANKLSGTGTEWGVWSNQARWIYPEIPAGSTWHLYDASGTPRIWRWKAPSELDSIDLRAKDWVASRADTFPLEAEPDYIALENTYYHALFGAFDANLSPSWRGKLRTCAYGNWSEGRQCDAASVTLYLGFFTPFDVTDPDYLRIKFAPAAIEHAKLLANPKAWPEWSIQTSSRSIYEGALNGTTAVIDPASYAGFMAHACWRMQSPGREARLTEWHGYQTPPDELLLTSPSATAALETLGREDMASLTVGDYEVAVLQALARIHDHPTINRYWREGTTFVLTSPLNTATSVKVYATETKIPYVTQTLLCVYTPCDLAGEIRVGEWTVPAKRFGYWLTGSIQEIE